MRKVEFEYLGVGGRIRFIDSEELARLFNVHKNSITKIKSSGKLKGVKIFGLTKKYYRLYDVVRMMMEGGLTEDEAREFIIERLGVNESVLDFGDGEFKYAESN